MIRLAESFNSDIGFRLAIEKDIWSKDIQSCTAHFLPMYFLDGAPSYAPLVPWSLTAWLFSPDCAPKDEIVIDDEGVVEKCR
jgi:hypothetical protein